MKKGTKQRSHQKDSRRSEGNPAGRPDTEEGAVPGGRRDEPEERGSGDGELGILYRAGLKFVGISDDDVRELDNAYGLDVKLGSSKKDAARKRRRTGPIKIRINPEDLMRKKE